MVTYIKHATVRFHCHCRSELRQAVACQDVAGITSGITCLEAREQNVQES